MMKWQTARFRTLVRDSLKQPPGGSSGNVGLVCSRTNREISVVASKAAIERGAKSRQVLFCRGRVDEHDAIAGANEPAVNQLRYRGQRGRALGRPGEPALLPLVMDHRADRLV